MLVLLAERADTRNYTGEATSGLNQKVSGQVRGLRISPSRMVHHRPRGTTLPRVDREGERSNPVVSP